jgi:serine/threonine-protein kinase
MAAKKRGLLGWLRDTNATPKGQVVSGEQKAAVGVTAEMNRNAPASVLERFENQGEIARGGMASIRKVQDVDLRRSVAMKVLAVPDGGDAETYFRVFAEEAQITGQLDHPNIVPVHEMGQDDSGTRFFTMKLVRGETLTELIHAADYKASNPDKLLPVVEVFRKVCDALAFAHSRGVIHRDLKPDNIMAGSYGQVYLMDWGVAKVAGFERTSKDTLNPEEDRVSLDFSKETGAAHGSVVGTLAYMAPEQTLGDDDAITTRTDIFGLGAILYEILTRQPPIGGFNIRETLVNAQTANIEHPQKVTDDNLPAGLCRICVKALSKEPGDRYPNVEKLKADIDAFLRGGWRFPSRTFALGETIVTEGEQGDKAYIIVSGTCRVYKLINGQQVALTDLGPGDVFGETAVFAKTERTATVQAYTEVSLLEVTRDVLDEELGLGSWVGSFVSALAKRYVETDKQLRELQGS